MDSDLKLKKQVSSEQLDALVQFLKEYPELAKGLTRGRRGKLNTFKLWNLCAKKLNVLKDGSTKDGKMWSKYWCDLKYRVRRRALELRAAEQSNTIPENTTPLTALEEEILSIIGQGALDSIIIKTDPLADADINNIKDSDEKNSEAIYSETKTKIKAGKKRCNTSTEVDEVDHQGVSSCDKKPKLTFEDDSGRDEATEFLRLEREKLEYIKKSSESLELIAPAITSAYGKVVLTEENLKSISDNLIAKNTKPVNIHIELPIVKDILSVVAPVKEVELKPEKTAINENDNIVVEKEGKIVINTKIEAGNVKKCQSDINENVITSDESIPCEIPVKEDNGTALILTPFIENGQIDKARDASKVNSTVFFGFDSYSGFITVNKTYNSNIFFWYFPVENKPVNETPWIIWLQGGPGASSLTGLFDEIGPFKLSPFGTLKKNPYTWLQNHSLVFIDNPVGTGYSFTEHSEGFVEDMTTYGAHLHEVVKQLLQMFPELKSAPLYIAGESYAGKYVPALGIEIHKHKNESGSDVNFQGLIIGNGYVDPKMISQLTMPFYYFGMLNKEQIKVVDPLIKSFQNEIARNNSIAAKNKWTNLVTILLFLSHQKHAYNFLKDELPVGRYVNFLKTSEVKRAIHVGDIKFSFVNLTVNSRMAPDFLSSSKQIFEELLVDYRVLAYCGQLDSMLPCIFASENYRTWKWNASSDFLGATRYPYIYSNKLAGYYKTGGHFTEAVIRGAGHMVPVDEPAPIQNLVARWTHNKPLSERFGLLEGSFVQEFVKNNSMIYF